MIKEFIKHLVMAVLIINVIGCASSSKIDDSALVLDYEFESTKGHNRTTIEPSIGESIVEFTIEPLQLYPGDGKGLEIIDASGALLFFSIDDGYSAIIWDNDKGVVKSTNHFSLHLNTKYQFRVHVSSEGINVYRILQSGSKSLFTYRKSISFPVKYNLVTQRSGARFYNVEVNAVE